MHFKASEIKPKATLEIGDKTYQIFSPTVGQADSFSAEYQESKDDNKKIRSLMRNYICSLGKIEETELLKLEDNMFMELFEYITTPKKK